MTPFKEPKLFLGPMSKTIVDIVCDYPDPIGLIPSRRQIEYTGGYVNSWDTKQFASYVRSKSDSVMLVRDHGGPSQGDVSDDGSESLYHDCKNGFDMIHLDPWIKYDNLDDGITYTIENIKRCLEINPDVRFEVGTEEAIIRYSDAELEGLLGALQKSLGDDFNKIDYAVIQSGTKLSGNRNIGVFDEDRVKRMIDVCKHFDVKSKEHNGDYLSSSNIHYKFNLGMDAINIAPEFGYIETKTILDKLLENVDTEYYYKFYNLCYDSNRWVKWLPKDIEDVPQEFKNQLILRTAGHYIFSHEVISEIRAKYPSLEDEIHKNIKNRINSILGDFECNN